MQTLATNARLRIKDGRSRSTRMSFDEVLRSVSHDEDVL